MISIEEVAEFPLVVVGIDRRISWAEYLDLRECK
jgi:hypothetical protein